MKRIIIVSVIAASGLLLLRAQNGPRRGGEGSQWSGDDHVKPAFEHKATIREANGKRIIESNGIPDHDVGHFPRRGNPNTIAPQNYHMEVPLQPKLAEKPSLVTMQAFGVAVNGVVFDPNAAEWWQNDRSSGWQYEANSGKINLGLDLNSAHVQPNGAYHYHGIPKLLIQKLNPDGKPKLTLVGWAADGFPIYARWDYSDAKDSKSEVRVMKSSYQVKKGNRPTNAGSPGGKYDGTFLADYEYVEGSGDLDESGGRFGVTPENPDGIYHYVLTDDYPFIPRLYKGAPDKSFERHGPPPGGGGPGGPSGRRRGPPPGGGFLPPGFPPPPPEK